MTLFELAEYQQRMGIFGFEVLTVVIMRRKLFWAVTLCSSERARNLCLSPNYTALQPRRPYSSRYKKSYKWWWLQTALNMKKSKRFCLYI
jgi:hypothetical protein